MITMVRIWRKEVKMSDLQVEMGRLQEVVVEITTTQMCLASPFSSMRRRGADITGSVDDFFSASEDSKNIYSQGRVSWRGDSATGDRGDIISTSIHKCCYSHMIR